MDAFLDVALQGIRTEQGLDVAGLLPAIATIVGAEIVGWHRVRPLDGQVHTALWPDPKMAPRAERLMQEYASTHPLLVHYATTGSLDVLSPIDVCSLSRWQSSTAFDLIKSEYGTTEQLAIPLSRQPGEFVSIAVGRTGRSFNTRERDIAIWVQRTLMACLRNDGTWRLSHLPRSAAAERLSPRERQVLWVLSEGTTRAASARLLGISPRTLDKHMESVFHKLGVNCLLGALNIVGPLVARRKSDAVKGEPNRFTTAVEPYGR